MRDDHFRSRYVTTGPPVLREIVEKFGGKLALNCYLIRSGEIHVSDDVQLVEHCEHEGLSGREAYLDGTSFVGSK